MLLGAGKAIIGHPYPSWLGVARPAASALIDQVVRATADDGKLVTIYLDGSLGFLGWNGDGHGNVAHSRPQILHQCSQ
jgi:hypothetical protein